MFNLNSIYILDVKLDYFIEIQLFVISTKWSISLSAPLKINLQEIPSQVLHEQYGAISPIVEMAKVVFWAINVVRNLVL
jgi:hypothetical protein